jgi:hypothetical protein
MIDIPIQQIIAKIKEQKGLSEAEIHAKIQEKLKQLAGLISEDGAAHIIANELGVQLIKEGGEAKIRDLYPGMRSVTVPGRVTRKFELRTFNKQGRDGKVAGFIIGDETGQVRVTLWNDQTDLFGQFNEGDVVRVRNAFVKENRGAPELHLNTDSRLEIRPNGVSVGAVQPQGARAPRDRKSIKEMTGTEENVELLATVVQVYDPRYFEVCAQCNKRVTQTAAGAQCPAHGTVTPMMNYVVSAFLDDGTGNMRTTFWKQQAQRLLAKTDEEMLAYKDDPKAFEAVKTEMLGEIVKIVGRCKKNETFDRVELTANLVFRDIDPEEELARLNQESSERVEKLDASPAVKEKVKEMLAPASKASGVRNEVTAPAPSKKTKVEVEEAVFEGVDEEHEHPIAEHELGGDFEEDAISLDDLDELE